MNNEPELDDSPDKKYGIIYLITNQINGKIYIGQTIQNIKKRFETHAAPGKNRTTVISKAIKKYGKDNFSIEIIDDALSKEELNKKEIFYINSYSSLRPYGYNVAIGGCITSASDESKSKVRSKSLENNGSIGVFKVKNRYHVHIRINNTTFHAGSCVDENVSKKIYNSLSRYYYGDFAVTNYEDESNDKINLNDAKILFRKINNKSEGIGVRSNSDGIHRVTVNGKFISSFTSLDDAKIVRDYYARLVSTKHALNYPDKEFDAEHIRFLIDKNKSELLKRRKINKKATSIYNGVHSCLSENKWASKIRVNKKDIRLGYFIDELSAAIAFDQYIINNNLIDMFYKINFKENYDNV